MRMSRLLVRTLREAPADAEVASHQLLVRAGYIRRLASGVYTFLPLGLRVLHRIERVIRRGARRRRRPGAAAARPPPDRAVGAVGSGRPLRDDALPAMTVDGRGGTFVLGPTHEEVVTVTVGRRGRLVPPAAAHRLPDPGQVPRRGPAPVRPAADPRAHHGRRVLLRRRQGGHAGVLPTGRTTPTQDLRALELDAVPVEAESGPSAGTSTTSSWSRRTSARTTSSRCPSCGYAANVEAATRAGARRRPRRRTPAAAPRSSTTPRGGRGSTTWSAYFADRAVTAADFLKSLAVFDDHGAAPCSSSPATGRLGCPAGWRLFDDADFDAQPGAGQGLHRPGRPQDAGSGWWPTSVWPGPALGSSGPTGSTTT